MDAAKSIVRKGSGFFKRDKSGHHTFDDGDEAAGTSPTPVMPASSAAAAAGTATTPQRPSHLRKDSTSSIKAAMQYAAHLDQQPATSTASQTVVTSPSSASVGLRRRSDSFAPSPLAMSTTKGSPGLFLAMTVGHVHYADLLRTPIRSTVHDARGISQGIRAL